MRLRIIALVFLLPVIAAIPLSLSPISKVEGSNPQRRSTPGVQRPRTPPRSGTDYSKFFHATKEHQQACNTCHKVPTANWRTARDFPDVADYPGHDACVSCHRREFFRGARPPICTVCHLRSSPRDEARFHFRNPEHLQQFTIEFPHDKHQDVIAALRPLPGRGTIAAGWPMVSFIRSAHVVDDKQKVYNNCTICHAPNQKPLPSPVAGWPDRFVPSTDTFKTVPGDHSFCFNCHWKAEEPTRENCAGCHKSAPPHKPVVWWPRISVKFTHTREQHVAECTTCHINITRASTLRGLKPDVPISSCASCHKTSTDKEIVTLEIEIDKRKANASFTCAKCHTSDVGRKEAPASHYSLFED